MKAQASVFSALTVAALTAACGAEGGESRFLSIGTAGTGGVYYPLGGALANRLTLRDEARQYTAEVTGGSVENVNRIREGQIEMAMALGGTIFEAYNGGTDYEVPVADLRVIAPLYANMIHVVVRGRTPIQSMADLAGHRVSVGSPGSGNEQSSRQLLESVGLDYEDIDVRYLSFGESASALRDGAIDAALISVGYPAAAVLEVMTTSDARIISISGGASAKLRELYPYYTTGTIPVGVYPGLTEPVETVAMMNWMVADESLPADVVTNLLDILVEDQASLAQVHEMARSIDPAALADAPIPLHPATTAWLEAHGG